MKLKKVLFLFTNLFLFGSIIVEAQLPDSLRISLNNLGEAINSKYPDYAPVVSADGSTLIFTSKRPATEKEHGAGKAMLERIYISNYQPEKDSWSKAVIMDKNVNAHGRNNSAIALSNDGQQLLLFRDDIRGNGDIYESVLKGKTWSEAVKLPEPVNTPYHESSASYAPDGNTLYFVSDRKGGQGGRDIWYSNRLPSGGWGEAVNMGPVVNTKENEEGVYLHPDGKTLYFSSKGHRSSGGYDIYKSVYEKGQWTSPQSLGTPLNSPKDDVFFVLEANGKKGYLATSAPGGLGDEDIYQVTYSTIEKVKGPQLTILKGIVYDEVTNNPLEAKLELTDNASGKQITTINSNSATGKYLISLPSGKNYGLNITADGYLFHSVNVFMPDTADYIEIEKNIGLKKLEVGSKIVLNNIFYDFDQSTLRIESISELQRLIELLNSNKTMSIELLSHTDGMGSDDYNIKLSQARAQSVVDYLSAKGIDNSRLVAKGYGKSMPVASNDTEEGRQLNRRTEFKVISK